MTSPVKIVAILRARDGLSDELLALFEHLAANSRAEPGNIHYELWRDQVDANRFVLDELYTSETAVAEHRETAHFKSYLARINDLAERSVFLLAPAKLG
jgi:quinol monooxygenase YgiN